MIIVGNKYIIVNSVAGNNGKVVTVTGYAGYAGADGSNFSAEFGPRWFVDCELNAVTVNTITGRIFRGTVTHAGELQLAPFDDGREVTTWEDMKDVWVPERIAAKMGA